MGDSRVYYCRTCRKRDDVCECKPSTVSDSYDLEPCPFCGGTGSLVLIVSLRANLIGPQCQRCGANIQNISIPIAVEYWNRRL